MGSFLARLGVFVIGLLVGLMLAFTLHGIILRMQPDYRGQIASLTSERDGARGEITKLKTQIDEASATAAALRRLRQERAEQAATIKDQRERLARLRSARDDLQKRLAQRNDATSASDARDLADLRQRLRTAEAARDRLRGMVTQRTDKILSLSDQVKRLGAQISGVATLEKATADQAATIAGLREKLATQQKSRAALEADVEQLRSRLATAGGSRDEIDRLKTELDGRAARLAKAEAARDRLRRLIVQRTDTILALTDQQKSMATKLTRLADLEKQSSSAASATDALQRRLDVQQAANRRLEEQRDALQQATARQSAELARLRAGESGWAGRLATVQATLDRLRTANAQRERASGERLTAMKTRYQAEQGRQRDALQQCQQRATQCTARLDDIRAARRARAQACQAEMRQIAKQGRILFASGSARLTTSSFATLDRLAARMNACDGFAIAIEGHTDSSGPEDANRALSQDRANSVRAYLVEKAGVSPERLKAAGLGSGKPLANNRTPEGRQINRRIEFSVAE